MNRLKSTFLVIVLMLAVLSSVFPQGVMISNDPAAPAPSALLQTFGLGAGDGNVLFMGEWKGTPGPVPALNAGTRMMWYPDKAAFRAGRVTGTQWNTENIGNYSSATGFNSIASGWYSNAWGSVTTSSGAQATSWGFNNIASGTSSTAWGENTKAPSFAETVFGYNNTAYTPASSTEWIATDRLFVIGNGISGSSDALVMLKNGNTGLGLSDPLYRLHASGSVYASTSNWAIRGVKTGTTGTFPGVWGETESASANANGIRGFVLSTTSGSGSAGVFGKNFGATNANYGVFGEAVSASGRGVYGLASATSGTNYGVYGRTESPDGFAAYFTGVQGSKNYFGQNVGIGTTTPSSRLDIQGDINSTAKLIIANVNFSGQENITAVQINCTPGNGFGTGISISAGNFGVYSIANNPTTGTNPTYGVYSRAVGGMTTYGVYGWSIGDNSNYGIYGRSNSTGQDYAGYFSGNVTVTGNFNNPSDAKLKRSVARIDGCLDKVMQLNGRSYENKTEEFSFMNLAEGPQFGFIAQELETVFPELVKVNHHPGSTRTEEEEGTFYAPVDYKGINYIGLVPVLTEAIKELHTIIETQNQRIDALEKQLNSK